MRDFLKISLAVILCLGLAGVATAQTPDGETPADEGVCDGEKGAAFGLCNAYCEAMDCDSDNPNANQKACDKVKANYERITGGSLPCDLFCPCFTAEELLALGPVSECGENIPGFPDLAGWAAQNGIACSGTDCTGPDLACGYVNLDNGIFRTEVVDADTDADCRTIIVETCPNPNISNGLTPSHLSGTTFIDP